MIYLSLLIQISFLLNALWTWKLHVAKINSFFLCKAPFWPHEMETFGNFHAGNCVHLDYYLGVDFFSWGTNCSLVFGCCGQQTSWTFNGSVFNDPSILYKNPPSVRSFFPILRCSSCCHFFQAYAWSSASYVFLLDGATIMYEESVVSDPTTTSWAIAGSVGPSSSPWWPFWTLGSWVVWPSLCRIVMPSPSRIMAMPNLHIWIQDQFTRVSRHHRCDSIIIIIITINSSSWAYYKMCNVYYASHFQERSTMGSSAMPNLWPDPGNRSTCSLWLCCLIHQRTPTDLRCRLTCSHPRHRRTYTPSSGTEEEEAAGRTAGHRTTTRRSRAFKIFSFEHHH